MKQNRISRYKLNHKNILYLLLPYLCILVLALFLLLTLVGKQEFWTGYDTYFHMNGIYEAAEQIKTGHFSYFISLFGFERSGRIVNSLYGPVFNYLCGALLLAFHSWIRFEFWLFLVTLMIGGCGVYCCSRTIHLNKPISTILAMFYLISKPVLFFWIGNFEFTGLGATDLLPFVVLAGIKIFQQRRIKVVPLAVLMAICLQIHLMTTLISCLVLAIFALGGFMQSDHKVQMIKQGLLAALLAFCLSGNIFGTLYDVYSTNHLVPTFPNFHLQTTVNYKALAFNGLHLTELGRVYTFFLALVLLLMLIKRKSTHSLDWCLLAEDLVFLWLSTTYFPWDRLLRPLPWLASVIQFPSRFMAVSFLVTLLLVGRVLTEVRLKPKYTIIGLSVIFLIAFYGAVPTIHLESRTWQSSNVVRYWVKFSKNGGYSREFHHGSQLRNAFRSHDLADGVNVIHKITSDYMPASHRIDLHRYYHYPINQEYIRDFQHQNRFHKFTEDHTLLMNWRSNRSKLMTVPLVKYGNTVVRLNHKRVYPKQTLIGTMRVRARRGVNQMSIRYQPGKVFKLLSLISIISWLVVIWQLFKRRFLL